MLGSKHHIPHDVCLVAALPRPPHWLGFRLQIIEVRIRIALYAFCLRQATALPEWEISECKLRKVNHNRKTQRRQFLKLWSATQTIF
jgi:hypothetical protein